jgi:predicted GIY-YIG superfamily endonuclease
LFYFICDNILFCDQKTFYIGITDNLVRRLKQYRNKKPFYTKKFSDIEIFYTEIFLKRSEAEKREKQVKKGRLRKREFLYWEINKV